MAFFDEAFIVNSTVQPETPASFDSRDVSNFFWEEWINLGCDPTETGSPYFADNGAASDPSQLAPREVSLKSTSPLNISPYGTSSHYTSTIDIRPYLTSSCAIPSTVTASYATSPYTTTSSEIPPHSISSYSTPPYNTSTDIGHFHDKNGLGPDHVPSFGETLIRVQGNGPSSSSQPMVGDHSVGVGASANGISACTRPHNYHLARPMRKAANPHKVIGDSLNSPLSDVAATNGFPPLNIRLGHASGHNDIFESCRKPSRARSRSDTHLTQTKGRMQQTGADGLLKGEVHSFNFDPGNLPSFPQIQKSSNSTSSNYSTSGSNGDLDHLLEFQKWVLGLDATTMLRAAKEAGYHVDLDFESNFSDYGRIKSSDGQVISTTELTSALHGYCNAHSPERNATPTPSRCFDIPQNSNDPASSGFVRNKKPTLSPVALNTSINSKNYETPKNSSPFSPHVALKAPLPNSSAQRPPRRTAIVSKGKCDDKSAERDGKMVKYKCWSR